jgi:hypothetical protein
MNFDIEKMIKRSKNTPKTNLKDLESDLISSETVLDQSTRQADQTLLPPSKR